MQIIKAKRLGATAFVIAKLEEYVMNSNLWLQEGDEVMAQWNKIKYPAKIMR